MTLHYGQQLVLKHGLGKPLIAYVAQREPDDYLVKLSITWPYIPGVTRSFFVHVDKLDTYYDHPNVGEQAQLFERPATIYDQLRKKHFTCMEGINADSVHHHGSTSLYLFSTGRVTFSVIADRTGKILETTAEGYSEYTDIREMVAHLRLRGFEVEII